MPSSLVSLLASALITFSQAPADPATVTQLPQDKDSNAAQCGNVQLTWTNLPTSDPASQGSATLHATAPDGSVMLDRMLQLTPGERLLPLWCGDLLGDGSQVLAYEIFSGGAHCCFSATLVPLQPQATDILQASLGNGGLTQPQQLDASGPLEVLATSDVFAYFDDLSFVASPFLPLIYAYDPQQQQYVESTHQFPDRIESAIDQANADLADAVARKPPPDVPANLAYQEQESVALRLYGLHLLLGDGDAALTMLQGRVAPPVADWLRANAPAAQAAMAQVYDLGTPPSASVSK